MAAPSTYITVIKRFTYRGDNTEEFSNSYALSGSTPTDSTAWRALLDALVLEEKKLYSSAASVVAAYGYDGIPAHGDHAIWAVDLTVAPNAPVAGTLTVDQAIAGDQAAWVRWGLDRFNTKGKRVYLRKYFHCGSEATGAPDSTSLIWKNALAAFGTKMMDGSFTGGRKIVDKDGNVPISVGSSSYITTRTLKRRGKRPPT